MEKIEELKIKLHSNISPRKVFHLKTLESNFKDLNISLYRCSMDLKKKIEMTEHPVLTAYYTAFLEHYPVIVSPDILWMLILEGFSRHVRLNSKKLKTKFVKRNDDKLVIIQDPKDDKNINKVSSKSWGDIFTEFVDQSKEYIDGTVLHLFIPYFSTTTEEIEYSCQLSTISIIIPYITFIKKFRDRGMCGGCAFPYIKLQGTLQDYKQLKLKVEGLKGYLIDDWIKKISLIIDKIIETKKGNVDKQFWDNMITNKKRVYKDKMSKREPDAHEANYFEEIKIFGWIFDFFPYKYDYKYRRMEGQDYSNIGNDFDVDDYYNKNIVIKERILVRNDIEIYYDSNFNELPEEIIKIDATYKKKNGQIAKLGIKTGFLGYSIDKDHAFKPEIGWYFYIIEDPNNLVKNINNVKPQNIKKNNPKNPLNIISNSKEGINQNIGNQKDPNMMNQVMNEQMGQNMMNNPNMMMNNPNMNNSMMNNPNMMMNNPNMMMNIPNMMMNNPNMMMNNPNMNNPMMNNPNMMMNNPNMMMNNPNMMMNNPNMMMNNPNMMMNNPNIATQQMMNMMNQLMINHAMLNNMNNMINNNLNS